MTDQPDLSQAALQRLQKMGQGNGLKPEDFEILESASHTIVLEGELRLSPDFDQKSKRMTGALSNTALQLLPTLAALDAEVGRRKAAFDSSKTWVQEVVQELEKDPTHGWGHQDAMIALPDQTATLGATDSCKSCEGKGITLCNACRGQKQTYCPYCESRKEEPCYHCQTTGQDPAHPHQPCPVCHGTRFAPCRYCHATGMIPCPTCQGRGGTTCPDCRGAGKTSRIVKITVGAKTSFKLKDANKQPSNLLRCLDILGPSNLGKGHADVEIVPQKEEDDPRIIPMKATFPYTEIKLRVLKSTGSFAIFGKKNAILGVPAFLDRSLKPWQEHLIAAAKDSARLEKAMEARAVRDVVLLTASGKAQPTELRRLYPYGLSLRYAEDLIGNAKAALKILTRKAEIIACTASIAVGALAAAALRAKGASLMTPPVLTKLSIALPVLSLLLAAALAMQAGRYSLKRALPKATPPALALPSPIALGLAAAAALVPALILWI